MEWGKLLAIIGAGLIIWLLFRSFKSNPEMFSKENFTKSFGSMGILGLVLIVFIGLCVLMLRAG